MKKQKLMEILRELYEKEHGILGEKLHNSPQDAIPNNWQGGKVNGIGTVLDLIQNLDWEKDYIMFKYVVEYYLNKTIKKQVEVWATNPENAIWKADRIHGNLSYDPEDKGRWIVLGWTQTGTLQDV